MNERELERDVAHEEYLEGQNPRAPNPMADFLRKNGIEFIKPKTPISATSTEDGIGIEGDRSSPAYRQLMCLSSNGKATLARYSLLGKALEDATPRTGVCTPGQIRLYVDAIAEGTDYLENNSEARKLAKVLAHVISYREDQANLTGFSQDQISGRDHMREMRGLLEGVVSMCVRHKHRKIATIARGQVDRYDQIDAVSKPVIDMIVNARTDMAERGKLLERTLNFYGLTIGVDPNKGEKK